ncbi:esterase FE4-like [Schistocerca serialis cubense]|uniref:esterase FE4-like n=1 Tax=Schistocerca serialis cubense TaxID=2023355 RepID=UPI00214E6F88|nr:esterase FE4-like [Schistocerca serialis cubense]
MADGPTVRVCQGALRGSSVPGAWTSSYLAFRGIPYAQPPVGELRFKPPQPGAPWSGVRDATSEGSVAPQLDGDTGRYVGNEDCLFLNVYTPRLPSEATRELLPVMVLVHGGGLVHLSGSSQWWGPDFLVRRGVVMVSFNYRLGVLGFLATGDSVVPGNMGFKDQVMALRWVRDNIASFGGDPDNVTIFGVSAGGWSCHALMMSPLAKGLFRRVIAQSGVAVGDGAFSARVPERSFALAAHLGLTTTDSSQLLDILARQPATALVENTLQGRTEEDKARGLMFPFVGTVEPAGEGAFLTRHPEDILRSGDFQQLPLITGATAFEGSLFLPDLLKEPKIVTNYAVNHRLLIPYNLRCRDEDRDTVAEQIRSFYFGDRAIGMDTMKELCMLRGDAMFTYPAVRAATAHSAKSVAPVYFYKLDAFRKMVLGDTVPEEVKQQAEKTDAAGHGADLGYLFRCVLYPEIPEPSSPDGKIIDTMTRLWTDFAKTGSPTPGAAEDEQLQSEAAAAEQWPAFSAEAGAYLLVSPGGFSVVHRPFAQRVAFWDSLYTRSDWHLY